jgi:hypothetical protein
MRLGLYFYENIIHEGLVGYNIQLSDETGQLRDTQTEEELEYLKTRIKPVSAMATKLLGDAFSRVEVDELLKCLVLKVRPGTATNKRRFDFRALCGWIELHDWTD